MLTVASHTPLFPVSQSSLSSPAQLSPVCLYLPSYYLIKSLCAGLLSSGYSMAFWTQSNGLVFKLMPTYCVKEVTNLHTLESNVSGLADESYWTNGYTTPSGCSPSFLSHLSQPILTCGKALHLLQVCQPQVCYTTIILPMYTTPMFY